MEKASWPLAGLEALTVRDASTLFDRLRVRTHSSMDDFRDTVVFLTLYKFLHLEISALRSLGRYIGEVRQHRTIFSTYRNYTHPTRHFPVA